MLNFFAVVNAITCALIGKVDKKLRSDDKQRPVFKIDESSDAMQRRSPTRGPRKCRRPNKTKAINNYYCSAVPFCSNFENSKVHKCQIRKLEESVPMMTEIRFARSGGRQRDSR